MSDAKPAPVSAPVAPIVILGGAFAGLTTAHTILRKHLIPSKASGHAVPKLIIIAPNTHIYWNPAAVRAIISTDTLPEDKLFVSLESGFKQYTEQDLFEIVHGRADQVDFAGQTVTYTLLDADEKETGTASVSYGHLIVATGATQQPGTPFRFPAGKGNKAVQTLLKEWQAKIAAADEIVISGGGPTGVETASEIHLKYPAKKVKVITSAESLLTLRPDVDATAKSLLEGAGVEVILKTKVVGTEAKDGKTLIHTIGPDGEKDYTVDLHLPAHGLIPNSQFLPPSVLDSAGWVKVDKNLHIEGQTTAWAAGDITTHPYKVTSLAHSHAPIIAHNIAVALDLPSLVPTGCNLFGTAKVEGIKEYTPKKTPDAFVPIVGSGTGYMNGMKFPGFMVHQVKGKVLFIGMNKDAAEGKGMFAK